MPSLDLLQTLGAQLRTALDGLGAHLVEELQKELIQQGHKLTGKLVNSIEHAVTNFRRQLSLEISYLRYGAIVNDGVRASRVPFGGKGTGAKTSKYIQALIRWVELRNIAQGIKAQGVAFAIARKHKKEGIPTVGSRAFSRNGRRVGFQNIVLADNLDRIEDTVSNAGDAAVNAALDVIVGRITI
jgi:hypothetical protein